MLVAMPAPRDIAEATTATVTRNRGNRGGQVDARANINSRVRGGVSLQSRIVGRDDKRANWLKPERSRASADCSIDDSVDRSIIR